MNLIKEIQNRRSVRNYLTDEISKDTVLDILQAGIMAPSAKNNQPWRFVIVSTDIKNKISDKMVELVGPNKDRKSVV